MNRFKVGVVGTGYVGLVTGACLAYLGHCVTCLDRNEEKVARLRERYIPIYEPHLEEMVSLGVEKDRLSFAAELPQVVGDADVLFIAVDTPQGEDGSADLSSVATVARPLAEARRGSPNQIKSFVLGLAEERIFLKANGDSALISHQEETRVYNPRILP